MIGSFESRNVLNVPVQQKTLELETVKQKGNPETNEHRQKEKKRKRSFQGIILVMEVDMMERNETSQPVFSRYIHHQATWIPTTHNGCPTRSRLADC